MQANAEQLPLLKYVNAKNSSFLSLWCTMFHGSLNSKIGIYNGKIPIKINELNTITYILNQVSTRITVPIYKRIFFVPIPSLGSEFV
jgi:hypothetical protein